MNGPALSIRCTFAVMTVMASGISLDLLAGLLNSLFGLELRISALIICSAVVLVYVLKGGLTSAMYTEVLQFFMIVLGFAPVVWLGLHRCRRLVETEGRRCRRFRSTRPSSVLIQTIPSRPTRGRARGRRSLPGPSSESDGRRCFCHVLWPWASFFRLVTGAPTFSSCSAPWPRKT